MEILLVRITIKPEMRDAFLELARDDAENSVQEPGCVRFDVLEDTENAGVFVYYEVYRDEAAVAAHRETPHFKRYFEKIDAFLAAPTTRSALRNVIPSDADWR
jgi:autoinducer 2-degrading protein